MNEPTLPELPNESTGMVLQYSSVGKAWLTVDMDTGEVTFDQAECFAIAEKWMSREREDTTAALAVMVRGVVWETIMAERERCADIARRTYEGGTPNSESGDSGFDFMGENSAQAILDQPAPWEQQ